MVVVFAEDWRDLDEGWYVGFHARLQLHVTDDTSRAASAG